MDLTIGSDESKLSVIIFSISVTMVHFLISGAPSPSSYDDVIAAAKAGQWDQVQDL